MGNIRAVLVNAPAALAHAQVAGLSGNEGLSQLFYYQVVLLHPAGAIDISTMIGETLAVEITGDNGANRYFHGRIAEFAEQGPEGRHFRYQFILRPTLWFLSLNRHCRVFQAQSVIEVIKAIFRDEIQTDWRHEGSYAPLEYCVQYLESDLDFVCRLMEEQGLYYFFRHTANDHPMTIVDSTVGHIAIDGCNEMLWDPMGQRGQASLQRWQPQEKWRLDAAAARDFDYTKAMNRESGLLHARAGEGDSVWLNYPARVDSQHAAQDSAKRQRQAELTGKCCVVAETQMPAVAAGGIITFSGHYDESARGNYLIVEAQPEIWSEYSAGGACNLQFSSPLVLQKEKAEFLPARKTPRPVIAGSQTALVVGKAGEAQWVDRYGRIKVQFHWDGGNNQHDACSCWVRVAQPIAGDRWGSVFLPRVNQEVVITFLEGDPDRPLVTGCVYNAGMLPPYALPQKATRCGFKSHSFGDAGVFNEWRFEDKAGAEQLLLHAGRNKDVSVKNDALEWIGNDRHLLVKGNHYIRSEGDEHHNVRGKSFRQVGKDFSLHIEGKGACKVEGNLALMASKLDVKSSRNLTLEAGVTLTLKAGGSTLVLGPTGVSIDGALINIKANTLVNINSGSGAKASTAEEPNTSTPQHPKEADDGSL
ncbi:type VI secretion system Vgr family protein [Cedecea sp.]|jgi:type VI secretion system secreted protein VgrG|uniref:type VI secretion system Vgr family protein n=1 Tax=Cedecea sp. TaxID=1970739 RepID=UPI002F3EDC15